MKVTVLFFATLKDRAQRNRLEVDLPTDASLGDLKTRLAADLPGLAPALPTALASINHEFAFPANPLHDGDEVGFFPPVSGGAADRPTSVSVTTAELDLNALVRSITLPTTGATCAFFGVVRGETRRETDPTLAPAASAGVGPHQTLRLEYEAYAPMAEAKMQQVAGEIRARWPAVEGIAIVQRIGPLEPGTPTVLIACSAAHRDTGVFEAARYGIDRLKEIVPVWKKEIGPGGEVWVEGHYTPTSQDAAPPVRRGAR